MSSRARRSKHNTNPDEMVSTNVRFDYSAIYNNNEDLETELEDHESLLLKEQKRVCVESEQVLKKAKQQAEEMLSLKNALKKRDPNESSNRIARSASHKKLQKPPTVNGHVQSDNAGDKAVGTDMVDGSVNNNTDQIKPFSNMALFSLAIWKSKNVVHAKKSEDKDAKEENARQVKSSSANGVKPARPATVSVMQTRTLQRQVSGPLDSLLTGDRSGQYGIHVKRDHSRSRRTLEELSRLEQESKYGYVNKYEERRKRLLANCKDTKPLEDRIQLFLSGIDDFKKTDKATNEMEKVIMRSKSAHLSRKSSVFW